MLPPTPGHQPFQFFPFLNITHAGESDDSVSHERDITPEHRTIRPPGEIGPVEYDVGLSGTQEFNYSGRHPNRLGHWVPDEGPSDLYDRSPGQCADSTRQCLLADQVCAFNNQDHGFVVLPAEICPWSLYHFLRRADKRVERFGRYQDLGRQRSSPLEKP